MKPVMKNAGHGLQTAVKSAAMRVCPSGSIPPTLQSSSLGFRLAPASRPCSRPPPFPRTRSAAASIPMLAPSWANFSNTSAPVISVSAEGVRIPRRRTKERTRGVLRRQSQLNQASGGPTLHLRAHRHWMPPELWRPRLAFPSARLSRQPACRDFGGGPRRGARADSRAALLLPLGPRRVGPRR